jgi:hypothetical protein
MGKRKGRRAGGINQAGSKIIMIVGHELFTITSLTLTQRVLVPFSFTRALAVADAYSYYRFKKVKLTVHPSELATASGTSQEPTLAVGFSPGPAPDTPPASQNDVYNLSRSIFVGSAMTMPTAMTLKPKDLLVDSPIKWYKTLSGTPDTQWEQQGVFYFFPGITSGSAVAYNVTVDYEVEFQGLMVPTSTPVKPVGPSSDPASLIEYHNQRYMLVPPLPTRGA